MSNDWTELAEMVRIMQDVNSHALGANDEDALEFLAATTDATASRVEALQAAGIDVTDEMVLFTYCMGYAQATVIAHQAQHVYGFTSSEVDEGDECRIFVHAILANMLPLMRSCRSTSSWVWTTGTMTSWTP